MTAGKITLFRWISGISSLIVCLALSVPVQAGILPQSIIDIFNAAPSLDEKEFAPYRQDFRQKLPSKFRVVYPYLCMRHDHNVVDNIILKILGTQNGKRICSLIRNKNELKYLVGVHEQNVDKAVAACGESLGAAVDFSDTRSMVRALPGRHWLIFLDEAGDGPVESWTNERGQSALILKPSGYTEENLVKLIAHELAVFFDEKFRADTLWLRLYAGENISFSDNYSTDYSPCDVLPYMNQNHVAYGALTARALLFEAQILRELSMPLKKEHEIIQNNEISCDDKLSWLADENDIVVDKLSNLERKHTSPESSMIGCTVDEMTKEYALSRIQEILVTRQSMAGMSQNLACYMLEPMFGRKNIRTNHGPRPNITGGTRGKGGRGD